MRKIATVAALIALAAACSNAPTSPSQFDPAARFSGVGMGSGNRTGTTSETQTATTSSTEVVTVDSTTNARGFTMGSGN